jgi:transketolase N-terminal domain/subunit
VGTSLLDQRLAIGRMSVVAPITGVLGAGLPVLFGLATGERPGPAALTEIRMGLIAVVVITRAPTP